MNIPCPIRPDCSDDPSAVLANLSSEAPDKQVCIQLVSGVLGAGRKMVAPGKGFGDNDCIQVCEVEEGTDPFQCAFNAWVCAINKNFVCGVNLGDVPPGQGPGPAGSNPSSGGAQGGPDPTGGVAPKPTPATTTPPPPPGGGPLPHSGTTPGGIAQVFGSRLATCSVPCPDGSMFTEVVASGFFLAGSQAQADAMAASYACLLASQKKLCLTGNLPDACNLGPYSGNIIVSGNNPPYSLEITSGSLPPGLSLSQDPNNSDNFLVTGTPASGGSFTFTATATDPKQNFVSKTFTIHIFEISTKSITDATFASPYSFTLLGTGPGIFFWTLGKNTTLPDGLALDSNTGVISGTPWDCGSRPLTVVMEDLISGISCSKDFTITVGCPALNFNALSWGAPTIANGPGGSSGFSASGAHLTISATQPPPPIAGPGYQTSVVGGGSFIYSGSGSVCRVKVSVSISGQAGNATGQIKVFVGAGPAVATINFPGGGTTTFTIIGPLLGTSIAVTYSAIATGFFISGGSSIAIDCLFQPEY